MATPNHGGHRLLRRRDFQEIYSTGRKSSGRFVVIFCRRREDDGPWRVGLTATRKIGNAVERNRARRRAREVIRLRRGHFPPGWDFVVNLRHGAVKAPAQKFARDIVLQLHALGFTDIPETLDSMTDSTPRPIPEP